jgi:hypothetical protein
MGNIIMRIANKLLGITAALAVFTSTPAIAITDGELDGEGHPAVGLLIFDYGGGPAWRCSGTLISPTVMLTAGHCTDGAEGGRVWFDATQAEILAKGYPFGGSGAIEFSHIETHPLYPTAPFFVNDAGIVILSEPVFLADPEDYGVLPEVDELDQLKTRRGKQNQMFTAVGYGLQQINPVFVEAERTRMVAYPHLIQINVPGFTGDFSILLSNNHSTGGTCFGDSGGPNFIGTSNVIGGVTSFGINGNCAGTGGVFRIDRQNVLDFINSWL